MQKKIINIIEVADFNREVIKSDGLKIVRFCAEWSGPCQIMDGIYDEMHLMYNNSASFYKIDVDKAPLLKKEYGVTVLPTILFYQKGVIIDYIIGFISRESLIKKFEKVSRME